MFAGFLGVLCEEAPRCKKQGEDEDISGENIVFGLKVEDVLGGNLFFGVRFERKKVVEAKLRF